MTLEDTQKPVRVATPELDESVYIEDNRDAEIEELRAMVKEMAIKQKKSDAMMEKLLNREDAAPAAPQKATAAPAAPKRATAAPAAPKRATAAPRSTAPPAAKKPTEYLVKGSTIKASPITVKLTSFANPGVTMPDFDALGYPDDYVGTQVIGTTLQRIYRGPRGGLYYLKLKDDVFTMVRHNAAQREQFNDACAQAQSQAAQDAEDRHNYQDSSSDEADEEPEEESYLATVTKKLFRQ